LFEELECNLQPSDIVLNASPFWVRILNLPFDCWIAGHAHKLGKMPEVEKDEIIWDKSLRDRIVLYTMSPLRIKQKFKNGKGEVCFVSLKYERLAHFCYNCGCMGHTKRDCVEEVRVNPDGSRKWDWGVFLKASPRKGRVGMVEEVRELCKGRKALVFHTKAGVGS
ncbi:hypothetical protein SOVF_207550, partial [Spinacia oleracea]